MGWLWIGLYVPLRAISNVLRRPSAGKWGATAVGKPTAQHVRINGLGTAQSDPKPESFPSMNPFVHSSRESCG